METHYCVILNYDLRGRTGSNTTHATQRNCVSGRGMIYSKIYGV